MGILLEALLSQHHKWGRLVGFWLTGLYTPASFLVWSTTGLNVAGRTKKACAQAMVFIAFCTGFCIGPQTFYAASAPQYRPGLYYCCAAFGATEVVLATWYVWVRWENTRRNRRAVENGWSREHQMVEGCLLGLEDKTDKEVIHSPFVS
jgi:MFS transporter, ACS family, allantoate permease